MPKGKGEKRLKKEYSYSTLIREKEYSRSTLIKETEYSYSTLIRENYSVKIKKGG